MFARRARLERAVLRPGLIELFLVSYVFEIELVFDFVEGLPFEKFGPDRTWGIRCQTNATNGCWTEVFSDDEDIKPHFGGNRKKNSQAA